MKRLFMGNLSYQCKEDDLRRLCERHGAVESVAIIADRFSGASKGFAFVEYVNERDAVIAINCLQDYAFMGRKLTVAEAKPDTRGNGGRRSAEPAKQS